MCHVCAQHGRGQTWYLNFENYLFKKVFPTPEEQEAVKKKMIATFAESEWRYGDRAYIRNPDYLRSRTAGGLAAQVVTYEESMKILELAAEAVKREDSIIAVGHCPCVQVYRGERRYCCVGFGMPVSLSMEVGYGRLPREGLTEFGGAEWRDLRQQIRKGAKVPLTLADAKELFREWEKKGLWHLAVGRGRLPLVEAICNCERRYCSYWRNRFQSGVPDFCIKGHYIARIKPEACSSCGDCVPMCQFNAIHNSVLASTTAVDATQCFGCGLCRAACRYDAIEMVPREQIPVARNLW